MRFFSASSSAGSALIRVAAVLVVPGNVFPGVRHGYGRGQWHARAQYRSTIQQSISLYFSELLSVKVAHPSLSDSPLRHSPPPRIEHMRDTLIHFFSRTFCYGFILFSSPHPPWVRHGAFFFKKYPLGCQRLAVDFSYTDIRALDFSEGLCSFGKSSRVTARSLA